METKPAPTTLRGIIRHLGPGLIITATIVGSGELIATPALASEVGFSMLWFIILGCLIKVFVQIELGRYTVTNGKTTLEAMDSVPGPRLRVSWMVWFWVVMYIGSTMQVAGMMGGIASLMVSADSGWHLALIAAVALACIALLLSGRYRLVEGVCIGMVVLFALFTGVALGSLQFTEFAISGSDIADGLKFSMPKDFSTAFGAFAIIGVGTSELIYYPYWCLEKGYARFTGNNDNTVGWFDRALGWLNVMRWDAWVSCAIYTSATVAFYLLGAATLHSAGLEVGDEGMVDTLSKMYETRLRAYRRGVVQSRLLLRFVFNRVRRHGGQRTAFCRCRAGLRHPAVRIRRRAPRDGESRLRGVAGAVVCDFRPVRQTGHAGVHGGVCAGSIAAVFGVGVHLFIADAGG